MSVPALFLLLSLGVLRAGADDAPPSAPDEATATEAPPPAPSPVTLRVEGFSADNATFIQDRQAALHKRLAFLTGSEGVRVSLALVAASGETVVTIEETLPGDLDMLGLPQAMGQHRALDLRRPTLAAAEVNAWVATGPMRDAYFGGNMVLAEALTRREVVVRYTNASGSVLTIPFVRDASGHPRFAGLVQVTTGRKTTPVEVDMRTNIVRQPMGADGRPGPSAALYAFFDINP